MSLKPILFNTEMVQAILNGNKSETRRVVRQHYANADLEMFTNKYGTRLVERQNDVPEPESYVDEFGVKHTIRHFTAIEECKAPYNLGDILWVRETWTSFRVEKPVHAVPVDFSEIAYEYRADDIQSSDGTKICWRPSIHMPREAARLFLRVTGVRAERLQNIDAADIRAEGLTSAAAHCGDMEIAEKEFAILWDSTIKPADLERYGWEANPWVWVICFDRCEKPEGWPTYD